MIARSAAFCERSSRYAVCMALPKMVIAGAGGVIARHLAQAASPDYDVVALTRNVDGSEPDGTRAVAWEPAADRDGNHQALDELAEVLDGAAAVVNLAGASIGDGRMGPEHRRRVMDSRVESTNTLVRAVERTEHPPAVWIQGSASGYYGDRGDEILTEDSRRGRDFFLSDVTHAWEQAAEPAGKRCRLIVTRFGLILAEDAPAWQRMILPIRLFVGGPLGSGEQWLPWIDADELARAALFCIDTEEAEGPINFVAPEPVRQKELAHKAASRLGRPAYFPAPAPLLRLVLGGTADQLILCSQRVVPERLMELGWEFRHPDIDSELDELLR